jgi:hypothetical protein
VTGGQADPVAEQGAILARITEFVNGGVRAGIISDESGQLLIGAAEAEHDEVVKRLREEGPFSN